MTNKLEDCGLPYASLAPLKPYATQASSGGKRLYPEVESHLRSPFQRDRDRVIHSTAFRRLKHKTQVFIAHEGDHYRTRLTHSIEVAQIARTISRVLGVDEDLAEALSLAHDLGHTPFGHAGEDALSLAMQPYGGFSHNEQTFRILVELEKKYPAFDGLNLTWECLEGVVKHNGPLIEKIDPYHPAKPAGNPITSFIVQYSQEKQDLLLTTWPGMEAQVAAISDDIAYNNHDIDDGLRANLFTLENLKEISLIQETIEEINQEYPHLQPQRLRPELVRRLVNKMVLDVIEYSTAQINKYRPKHVSDIRLLPEAIVSFSPDMAKQEKMLKQFLFRHMYRHYQLNRMAKGAKKIVQELFEYYIQSPNCLPEEWQKPDQQAQSAGTARLIADYIAGMTDRFAILEHRRLYDSFHAVR